MWKKKNYNVCKNHSSGLTLIELIVTFAVLSIVSTIMIGSYTHLMEEKRIDSDLAALNSIDEALKQVLIESELYDDKSTDRDDMNTQVDDYLIGDNKVYFVFTIKRDPASKKGILRMENAKIQKVENPSGESDYESLTNWTNFYDYLTGYTGNIIELSSKTYRTGTYNVIVTYNGTQVSQIREYAINKDNFTITNSGFDNMTE